MDHMSKKFVIGCGGTGGHIVPALALAAELRRLGHETLFIGNADGMESRLVAAEGFPFQGIHVQKLYRQLSLSNLLFPLRLISSTIKSVSVIGKYRPDGVICTGGFVSGPVALGAVLRRIPLYFHESNSYPGLTTRYLARRTRITFISFAGAANYLKGANLLKLGVPLPAKPEREMSCDLAELGLDPAKPAILITGGSQGSQAINAAVDGALTTLLGKGFQLIWQTGKSGFATYSARHKDRGGIYLFDFSPKLPAYYGCAVLAVTRAGAMTLAELEQNALPAILVPLPTAAENHQHHNALEQRQRGLAELLPQADLSPQNLINTIETVYANLDKYRSRLRELPPNTATGDITQAILANLKQEKINAG